MSKRERQAAILEILRTHRVRSQEKLRTLLRRRGFEATQATVSRDLRDLRVVKTPHAEGESYYTPPSGLSEESPALARLLPHMMISAEGVGHLVLVKTLTGGAQAVAEAIDLEGWPEVMGTIAGDDTILIIVRRERERSALIRRLKAIAEG